MLDILHTIDTHDACMICSICLRYLILWYMKAEKNPTSMHLKLAPVEVSPWRTTQCCSFNTNKIKSYVIFPTIFFLSLLCLLSPNLARNLKKKLISASIKMFRTKKLKSKSPTDSRDFCPDPPSNEKLKSSLFWMN